MARKRREPGYCRHKPTNLGYAVFGTGTKPVYFPGPYGSESSIAAYQAAKAAWLAGAGQPRKSVHVTVAVLVDDWLKAIQAEGLYRRNGRPTSEVHVQRLALVPLARHLGATLVADFGAQQMESLRAHYLTLRTRAGQPWARKTVAKCLSRVRSLFAWGVGKGLVPATTYAAIIATSGQRKGKAGGRKTPKVRPAPAFDVGCVQLLAREPVRVLIWVQLLTGCRPGEAVAMTPADVDRSAEPWRYQVASHVWKLEHQQDGDDTDDEPPTYWIGPRLRGILGPILDHAENWARPPFLTRTNRPYTRNAYYLAVRKLCERMDIPHWTPNRLRHSHGTEVRKVHGIEASRVKLGHKQLSTSQIYSERDQAKARGIAEQMG